MLVSKNSIKSNKNVTAHTLPSPTSITTSDDFPQTLALFNKRYRVRPSSVWIGGEHSFAIEPARVPLSSTAMVAESTEIKPCLRSNLMIFIIVFYTRWSAVGVTVLSRLCIFGSPAAQPRCTMLSGAGVSESQTYMVQVVFQKAVLFFLRVLLKKTDAFHKPSFERPQRGFIKIAATKSRGS